MLAEYLPVYADADVVDGQVVALPAFADSMFLYYRADLLDKYGFEPPATWGELIEQAKAIQEGEGNDALQGLSYQGAAIEGANCTFLVPYWGAGGTLRNADGEVDIDEDAVMQAFEFLLSTIEEGVTKQNIAEVGTDDTRKEFQAGNVVFAINWGYAWNRFPERRRQPGQGQCRRGAAAGLRGRPAGDLHRRLAVGGQRLLLGEGGGLRPGAVPVRPDRVRAPGGQRLEPAGAAGHVRGSGRARGQPVVRVRPAGGGDGPVAAADAALSGGVGHDPHQRQCGAGGHQVARGTPSPRSRPGCSASCAEARTDGPGGAIAVGGRASRPPEPARPP